MRNYWSMNPDRLQRCLHERSPLAVRRVRQRDLVPLHDFPRHLQVALPIDPRAVHVVASARLATQTLHRLPSRLQPSPVATRKALCAALSAVFGWVAHRSRRSPLGDTGRAMSQENVELLHRAYDAFNRRDLDALLALCDPDVEFISYTMQVEGGDPYRGHDRCP